MSDPPHAMEDFAAPAPEDLTADVADLSADLFRVPGSVSSSPQAGCNEGAAPGPSDPRAQAGYTHHPECGHWSGRWCACGHTGLARDGLQPWTHEAFREWARWVNFEGDVEL